MLQVTQVPGQEQMLSPLGKFSRRPLLEGGIPVWMAVSCRCLIVWENEDAELTVALADSARDPNTLSPAREPLFSLTDL